ncbi:MAG: arsenate reductase ArsC [Acidobacteria bacterium]|nr:arsenate reductase ArsC [Acidobacteriota bacterium]NIQ86029.1 arsenate reductase ArsC [Acidobacteriota bacterium]
MQEPRIKLLFLCTGNSCRSQMAEGWTRHLKGRQIEVRSAGIEARGVDRRAVAVMLEAGVDISRQSSTRIEELRGEEFDYVVTVCDHAKESCPVFPAATAVVHAAFDDPPALVSESATEADALPVYRRVRDEIKEFVEGLPGSLRGPTP